jgi:Ca2+ transporting ATPase
MEKESILLKEKLLDNKEDEHVLLNPVLKKTKSKEFLSNIFESENIENGKSFDMLNEINEDGGLEQVLKTNFKSGLSKDDVEGEKFRKAKYGDNSYPEVEERNFLEFVQESLEDEMLRVLIYAAVVSLAIGIAHDGFRRGWMEGAAILFAVVVVVLISAGNNYSKEKQFTKLGKENRKKTVIVIRDSTSSEINIEEVLVGDILKLNIGDLIPVDGIIIKGEVKVDESSMTGESRLIVKNSTSPFISSGTFVQIGAGEMVVLTVGLNTQMMKMKEKLSASNPDDKTPLQQKLKELAEQIGDLGLIAAMFIGTIMIVKEILIQLAMGKSIFTYAMLDSAINAIVLSITVIVVAIPEGLPMAVTISLAYSVMKMKKENNLVRHLDASETMGNVNNILTDKTGTITEGFMSVRNLFMFGDVFTLTWSRETSYDIRKKYSDEMLSLLNLHVVMNISAHVEKNTSNGELVAKGNPTEVALLKFLLDQKIYSEYTPYDIDLVTELPFSSENKIMCKVYFDKHKRNYKLYIKGASEIIFDHSKYYLQGIDKDNGRIETLIDDNFNQLFFSKQDNFAEKGQRTLALAYKTITQLQFDEISNFHFGNRDIKFFNDLIGKGLCIFALFGISDAPRQDVKYSISKCQRAGITVRMITGDNIKTAITVAKEVGILTEREAKVAMDEVRIKERNYLKAEDVFGAVKREEGYVMSGAEFRELSGGYKTVLLNNETRNVLNDKGKFKNVIQNLKVLARATPDDKYLLTLGLKRIHQTVAVTGDGTNDCLALRVSHVGLSMGKHGTDIAKEASDIVLLDDSFSSIVTAVKFGRNVYDCIRKFLQFQLTANIVAVFMTLLGGVMMKDSPLSAIQMLWLNLIMDSFASLALATEPPSEDLLNRKPYKLKAPIITKMMGISIITQAIFQIIILSVIIFYGDVIFSVPSDREYTHFEFMNSKEKNGIHFTIFFNIFVFLQVFNAINSRKLGKDDYNVFSGVFRNYLFILVQFLIVFLQILIVQFGGKAMRTRPLTFVQHLGCVVIASVSLIVGLVVKLMPFRIDEDEGEDSGFRHGFYSLSSNLRQKTKMSRRDSQLMSMKRTK